MYSTVTIARQYGCGGREIGRLLSERLGIPCYDRDLIALAAERSGMNEEALGSADEKASSSLLYTLVMGANMVHSTIDPYHMPINDKLYSLQSEIIRELADRGDCIFIGRCADHILSGRPRCVRVFLYADFDARVRTVSARESLSESDARDLIIKSDRRRANYYNYYTGNRWGKLENYDLSVATDRIGPEGAAALIAEYARCAWEKQ